MSSLTVDRNSALDDNPMEHRDIFPKNLNYSLAKGQVMRAKCYMDSARNSGGDLENESFFVGEAVRHMSIAKEYFDEVDPDSWNHDNELRNQAASEYNLFAVRFNKRVKGFKIEYIVEPERVSQEEEIRRFLGYIGVLR